MPLIYLDNCALQRPLDDRNQFRIRIEADAITAILAALEAGQTRLVSSAVLRAEISKVTQRSRREFAEEVLSLTTIEAPLLQDMGYWLQIYEGVGIRPFDAIHLASAVAVQADYFCTTDDRFLKKARAVNTSRTHVVTPFELADALGL